MNKTLVLSDSKLFIDTVKLFVKNNSTNFLFKTENLLNFPSELFQLCKTENIANIIFFESENSTQNAIMIQKKYVNLHDLIHNIKIEKLITFVNTTLSNSKNQILNEESIFDDTNNIFNNCNRSLFRFNNLVNKLKEIETKCITIFHGEIFGRVPNDSIFSYYLEKFKEAKVNNQATIEIYENPNNQYQLTFIDNLVDVVLFLLQENDKIYKLNDLYWNIASPEIVKISDLILMLSTFFDEIDVVFKSKQLEKSSRFLSTEKFISNFTQYPYIKFAEIVRLILTD